MSPDAFNALILIVESALNRNEKTVLYGELGIKDDYRYADSLLNIAYLTQITNLRISNKNPLEYLQNYMGPRFDEVQRTHLLPDLLVKWAKADTMPVNALEEFVEARLELVVQSLQEYLQGIAFEVVDTRSAESSGGVGEVVFTGSAGPEQMATDTARH